VTIVTMTNGVSFLAGVLELCWRLEDAGVQFRLDVDGRLQVGPKDRLTPADFRAVQEARHRDRASRGLLRQPSTVM